MRQENLARFAKVRFQRQPIETILRSFCLADVMTQETATELTILKASDRAAALRPSDYFWRPWYAKVWWAAIAIYWAALAVFGGTSTLDRLISGWWFALTNIVFSPITAILILGFGLFTKMIHRSGDLGENEEEEIGFYDPANPFGFYSPSHYLGDPTDVRSPLNPANPAHPSHNRFHN